MRLRLPARNVSDHPIGLVLGHKLLGAQIDLAGKLLPGPWRSSSLCHKGSIAGLSRSFVRPELPENPVGPQPVGRLCVSHRRPITAPGPLSGIGHQVGPDRIQHHIAAEVQQVCLFFHQDRGEAALKEMSHSSVSAVVHLRVAAVQLAHAEGEVRLRRFNEEMIVIVHQTIGITTPAKAIDDMGKERAPLQPVAVVIHNVLPGIAPTRNMVHGARIFNAKRTGHGREYSEPIIPLQDLTLR